MLPLHTDTVLGKGDEFTGRKFGKHKGKYENEYNILVYYTCILYVYVNVWCIVLLYGVYHVHLTGEPYSNFKILKWLHRCMTILYVLRISNTRSSA